MCLSYELALIVDDVLKKQGYFRKTSINDSDFTIFTEKELNQIVELKLSEISDIRGIENLTNLKRLYIISLDFTKINTGESIENSLYINYINDFDFISKLYKLEELKIENDINIKSLDITNLKFLKTLVLFNNPNMTELIGLDKLENLESVIICGTNINSLIDVEKYISNTLKANTNILDINMYLSIIMRNKNMAKLICEKSVEKKTSIVLGEYIGLLKIDIELPKNIYDMYTILENIFIKNNLYNADDLEKISFAYNYLINNVRFDAEQLEKRNIEFMNLQRKGERIQENLVKRFTFLHSSYSAFKLGRANCEGLVNLMIFMLNMLNVPCFNVHCIDKKYHDYTAPNHSIIRILLNHKWYYCDLNLNEKENTNTFFLKTLDEISLTHVLNDFEIMIGMNQDEMYNARIIK